MPLDTIPLEIFQQIIIQSIYEDIYIWHNLWHILNLRRVSSIFDRRIRYTIFGTRDIDFHEQLSYRPFPCKNVVAHILFEKVREDATRTGLTRKVSQAAENTFQILQGFPSDYKEDDILLWLSNMCVEHLGPLDVLGELRKPVSSEPGEFEEDISSLIAAGFADAAVLIPRLHESAMLAFESKTFGSAHVAAAIKGNHSSMDALLDLQFLSCSQLIWKALIAASSVGQEIIVDLILTRAEWMPVDIRYEALFNASQYGHQSIALKLIKLIPREGVRLLPWVGEGLLRACRYGHIDTIRMLLDAGVTKQSRTEKGQNIMHMAAFGNHTEVIEFLKERGGSIDDMDREFVTPLQIAVQLGHHDAVKALVKLGADLNPIGMSGRFAVDALGELPDL